MKFGSLFAGIGGFDLGLERAGMECTWQVEIDPYCQKVLAKHWPSVERFSDVRTCGKHNLSAVDLICGGFPCQPFSVAGKQRGADDDRNLWPEMLRIVEECRPRWVVCENTPGIFGLYLDTVLAGLESAGYEAWTVDIPAAGVGAWHRRNRIWIVAHSDKLGRCESATRDATRNQERDDQAYGAERTAELYAVESGGENVTNPECFGRVGWADGQTGGVLQRRNAAQGRSETGNTWATEPKLGRVAYGIPSRVDRLRALGNAVVPQVVELIGRAIMAVDE